MLLAVHKLDVVFHCSRAGTDFLDVLTVVGVVRHGVDIVLAPRVLCDTGDVVFQSPVDDAADLLTFAGMRGIECRLTGLVSGRTKDMGCRTVCKVGQVERLHIFDVQSLVVAAECFFAVA